LKILKISVIGYRPMNGRYISIGIGLKKAISVDLYLKSCIEHTLTLRLPVYKHIVPGNWGKTRDISVDLNQPHSSLVDCARDLFKPSKDLASVPSLQ